MILQEQHLIPNTCSDLPHGPWLIFAPHPDDETFGLGGSILRAKSAGIHITVVVLTDGSQSSPDSNRDKVMLQREEEARTACQMLNVDELRFWRQPDRNLSVNVELIDQVTQLINELEPKSIFAPSPLEFHPDHRATATLVWQAVEQCLDFKQQFYFYDISNFGPCNTLIDVTNEVDKKREVMTCYASQQSEHDYIRLVQALNTARCYSLHDQVQAVESLWCINPSDYPSLTSALNAWSSRFTANLTVSHETPCVSVVVRTRDRHSMLQHALRSIIDQTYSNIELIVVNDGGVSPSLLLDELKLELPRLVLVELEASKGRAAAANAGINAATGDYLLFLDDDDWLLPQHLSKLVGELVKSEYLVAYSGVSLAKVENGSVEVLTTYDRPFDRHRLYFENYLPIHAVMFSRSLIDQGIRMDESLEVFEDWDFWLQVTRTAPVFKHVSGVSAVYRASSNTTTVLSEQHETVRKQIYARWAKTLDVNELNDLFTRLHLSHKS